MERFVVILAFVLIAASVAAAGRFRYPVKEGTRADLFFERLQLSGNFLALAVEMALPIVTDFVGVPALSFIAGGFQLAAIIAYRVQLPAIRPVRASTSGRHSVNEVSLRRTRWPYQTLFALGYIILLAYLFSIGAHFPDL
jgi:hypothetical protein